MTRRTYGVIAIANRHPALFEMLTHPREPDALLQLTDKQRHDRALFEARMRANQLRRLPTCFGELV